MGAGKRSRAAAAAMPPAGGGAAPAGKGAGRAAGKRSDGTADVPALEVGKPRADGRRAGKGRPPGTEQDGPGAAGRAGSAVSALSAAVPQQRNEVVLVGRVAAPAEERALPSGDVIVTWRLVVERSRDSRPVPDGVRVSSVDTFPCVAWAARERASALDLAAGDVVQVVGALRRRFWRTGGGSASVCEVEVAGLVRGPAGG